jgi:hypothetical protein
MQLRHLSYVILSEAKNLGVNAAVYTEMFENLASCFAFRCSASAQFAIGRIRRGGHDSDIYGRIQMVRLQRMLQLEKRPEPVQEVGRVLAFC